jgi:hypothetical protein
MSTRGVTGVVRLRMRAALVTLALALAVVVAIQASSIWWTRHGSKAQSVATHIVPSANPELRTARPIQIGCGTKHGCAPGANGRLKGAGSRRTWIP